MFVEGEVEVAIKDKNLTSTDDYDLKLWLQRGFAANSCYRVSNFRYGPGKVIHAVVAINTRIVAESEWKQLEAGKDRIALAQFIEKAFTGKGSCAVVGQPVLKAN